MIRDDPALPHLRHAAGPLAAPHAPFSHFDGSLRAPSLVLFVGPAARPERATAELLGQVGLRCAAVSDLDGAHAACSNMQFDALVIDACVLTPTLALGLAGLHVAAGCPLLVLSETASEVDAIVALEHGAAEYLVQPLSPRLLRAHLVAQLRSRVVAEAPAAPFASTGPAADPALAGWTLDPLQRELCRGTRRVGFTEGQFALLQCLAAQVGRLVPRASLEARVARTDSTLNARSIDVYVHRLRRRLAELGMAELEIESVRGRGYRLHCAAVAPGPIRVPRSD
ncbi:response regulator transcription factor [Aquincola sp. S2]|uniref:Response regulator transcription factor n=1 Tax=Pseudaquabacterium terrae TaxID=2732868 RepID=A0ABX2EIK0_9BURK|nr:response regulator transcription factor [Aquabacterium terrae]NRF68425.1 response regulator transcription factor [Aquabacterium terrae]